MTSIWLLDLSVSHHLEPDADQVPNIFSYLGLKGIMVENGSKLIISTVDYGSLHVCNNCFLIVNNTLDTPKATSNILSVQKNCTENYIFLEFHMDPFMKSITTTSRLCCKVPMKMDSTR